MNKNVMTVAILAIVGFGAYLFIKRKPAATGNIAATGSAGTPNIWGQVLNALGRPGSTPTTQPASNKPAYSDIAVAGIGALGSALNTWLNRPKTVPTTGGDRVSSSPTIVVPANSGSFVGDVQNYDAGVNSIDIDEIGVGGETAIV